MKESSKISPDLSSILDQYLMRLEKTLQTTGFREVHLIADKNSKKHILKIYDLGSKRARLASLFFQIEKYFLSSVAKLSFEHIQFPRLLGSGRNYLIIEFVEREVFTRESILDKKWSVEDTRLWVMALMEFQGIEMPGNLYPATRRLIGSLFPVVRLCQILPKCRRILSVRDFISVFIIVLSYIMVWRSIEKKLVHYELHTSHFAPMKGKQKMSLIDFELSYYKGDPLVDILYYISIPIKRFREWSFQKELLREYVKLSFSGGVHLSELFYRIRLILLMFHIVRYFEFVDVPNYREVYFENLSILLDKKRFRQFYEDIFKVPPQIPGRKSVD
ncbi:MAG: hypothetical protein WAU81_16335 [Candidatus Aminicenantales bacterium]